MKRPALHALLLACGLPLLSPLALAQWHWIDHSGRKIYSDRPPPPDVPDDKILRQPLVGSPGALPVPLPSATMPGPGGLGTGQPPAAMASAPEPLPKASGRDAALETRKKQTEQAEAARRKAAEEQQAQARAKAQADNCARAQRSLATLQSGVRIRQTNAQGEREVLDDTARAAELARVQAIVANDCP